MKTDREINQNSFWRKIKPVNVLGDSRLQNTLDRALRLAAVMTSKNIDEQLIQQFDHQSKHADAANANVAKKSIESALQHNRFNQLVGGMKRRQHKLDDSEDNLSQRTPSSKK